MKKLFAFLTMTALVFVFAAISPLVAVDVSAQDAVTLQSIQFSGDDVEVVPQGGATLDSLIDGDKVEGATSFSTAGIVLFKNTLATSAGVYTDFSLTVELNEETSVGGAVICFYKEYNSMIGLPRNNSVKVEYSTDGTAFLPVGTYTFTGEAVAETNEVQDAILTFDGTVNAAYLRFTFTYDDSPFTTDNKVMWEWMGLTEISVTGADETSEPDTSIGDTSDTPQTGDTPIWISVAAAAIAATGIVVMVARKK